MNNVGIVILTWNGLTHTQRCIESLAKSQLPNETQVVVVDNGSRDGTLEYLESLQLVKVIRNNKNLGYSRAVNKGIRALPDDFDVVLLNNDVELPQSDWLVRLQATAYAGRHIGVVGAKILRENGTVQHCGAYMPIDTYWGQQIAGGELDINQYGEVVEVESVVFACAYIKRSTLKTVGLLREAFFAYFEDSDYCLRCNLTNLATVMDGTVRVRHFENTSTRVNNVSHRSIFLASQKIFMKQWADYLEKSRYPGAVDWRSIINFPSGYAGTCRSLVEAMDHAGLKVSYKYAYGGGTVFPIEEPSHSSSYIVNCIRNRRFGKARVQVVYAQGDVFEGNTGDVKIGYTMLEVNGLPKEWVRQANEMDEVWVPSHFNVETFINAGVRKPIRVMSLGINPGYFGPFYFRKETRTRFHFFICF